MIEHLPLPPLARWCAEAALIAGAVLTLAITVKVVRWCDEWLRETEDHQDAAP